MAEAIVRVLIGKLGAALANEAATYGASLSEEELKSMKAYLHESEKFRDADETTGIFVNKIWELSFRIEDVVDEFMYKLEDNKHGGFAGKMKKRIKHVKVWRRLALRDINAKLEEAAKRRDRYVIPGVERHAGNSDHHARSTNQALCNAAKLKGWIVDYLEERNTKITTVWGMGGVGQTTLVDHVYKMVKLDFDAAAWVTVSKSYQVEDLLMKIARVCWIRYKKITLIFFLKGKGHESVPISLIKEGYSRLTGQKGKKRKKEIERVGAQSVMFTKEEPLENHSYMLFCKLAFWNSGKKRFPTELHDLAAKFLQKCEGLPIAIACIGHLLSCKSPTYSEWKNVYEKLESQSTKKTIPGVDNIPKVSLEDLPYQLKNCFLHFALFPEDYKLTRRRIIRQWITSGFIKEKDNKILEQVAEGYLSDLVNRSLLQVVTKESGQVKHCRMHDVIRHLSIEKAEKECFGRVYEGRGKFSIHGTRRLSIQSTNNVSMDQSSATNLRATQAFTSSVDIELLRPLLASSVLLSTLDLQGTKINKMLPNEVFCLFNLRFLGLRSTRIEILPEAIGRLQNLEVLDTSRTCLLSLPKDVAKLSMLRYLYATVSIIEGRFGHQGGVKVPRGIRNLTGLHVLQNFKASSETLLDVAALTELRKFGVDCLTSEHSSSLCSALLNMNNLVRLVINTSNENEVFPLEELYLPETLSKLTLVGQLEKERMPRILSSWLHLNNLSHLQLVFSKLDENSFPNFMVLRNLCFLTFFNAYDGKALCFSAQSFPSQRELEIRGASQLDQVEIEEDALGSLNKLRFSECLELMKRLPHGIEYLTALDELDLIDDADEFTEMLRQESEADECKEELMKINHVRD
uniref:NB-ARC domain-containing protein n=1 Tax=Setaria italica TaxID=4555 RepID=K3ZMV3_SETIT